MPRATRRTDVTLRRAAILRRREALGAYLAAWRASMGEDLVTWRDDARGEYAELSRTWFRLGLLADDLQNRATRAHGGR